MADIDLPIPGVTKSPDWAPLLNAAVEAINEAGENTATALVNVRNTAEAAATGVQEVRTTANATAQTVNSGRLSETELSAKIDEQVEAKLDGFVPVTTRDPMAVQAFTPIKDAIANRGTQRVSVLALGDSTFEGLGLTTLAERFPRRLREKLRTVFPVPGVLTGVQDDYLPAHYDTSGAIAALGPAVTSGVTKSASWGFGQRASILPATTTTDTITFELKGVTRFAILVAKNSDNAVMGVTVDGADVTGGAGIALARTNTGGFIAYDSGQVAAADRTVVISRISGGTVTVEGILAWHGESPTQGIRVIDSAHSGKQMVHFGNSAAWTNSLKAETPDIIVNGLGYNDYLNNVTLANFETAATNLLTALRSQASPKTPTILYVCQPAPRHSTATVEVAPWSAYVDVLKKLAAADVAHQSYVLDLTAKIPTWDGGYDTGYVQSDRIHPTATGADWVAQEVVNAIALNVS